jgi:diguanylate cyclase (GGDEF)-like protein/PAS domain S-box-containing protein
MTYFSEHDKRCIVAMATCGVVGFAVNLLVVPVPPSDDVGVHLGAAPALLIAGLIGPLWGGLAATLASLPLAHTPWLAAAEVLAAVVAGAIVRRGQFVLPGVVLFWGTFGVLAAAVQFGPRASGPAAFAGAASGFLSALVADLLLILPIFTTERKDEEVTRDFASHFAPALTVAGVTPLVAAAAYGGRLLYVGASVGAGFVATTALVASRFLGRRVSEPIHAALKGEEGSEYSGDNAFLDIAELVTLRESLASERAETSERIAQAAQLLEEREAAYGQLMKLSERLEERLELRGLENVSLTLSEQHYREAIELASDIVYTLDLEGRFLVVNPAGERFFGDGTQTLVGRHWRRTLAPGYDQSDESKDLVQSIFDSLYADGKTSVTTMHLAVGGAVRLLCSQLELLRDEDGLPLSIQGVARDVTELEGFQREVRELGERLNAAQERLHRRDRALNAVLRAARAINSELEIDQLLQHIIESAAAQIHADSGFVGLLDEGALTLKWYWRSTGSAWIDDHGPDVERGVTQVVLDSKRPYFCGDAQTDPYTDKEFTRRFGIRSMLVFPIFGQSSDPLGALALHNLPVVTETGAGRQFELGVDPADARFLEGLADLAAAAIQQSRLFERVIRQAETDPLTGLFNRRVFETRVENELARARRFNRTLTIVLVDIDNLKTINDTYGHPIGDAAICAVADVLATKLRRHDFAARLGGEEFAAVVVETRPEHALQVARGLCEAVRKCHVPRVGKVTASFGVATFPVCGTTIDDLVRNADDALYRAKRNGRNRVEVASPIE